MIVRMKEISLFTTNHNLDATILELGQLGVVDIQETEHKGNSTLKRRLVALQNSEKAISILKRHAKSKNNRKAGSRYVMKDPKRLIDRVLTTTEFEEKCRNRLLDLNQQLKWYQTWGENVSTKDINYLKEKGIYLRLYELSKSEFAALDQNDAIVTLSEQDGKFPVILLSRDKDDKLAARETELPALSIKEVNRQIKRKERQLYRVEHFLQDQSEKLDMLQEYQLLLRDQLMTQQVLKDTGDIEGKIKYLRGFIPVDAVDRFIKTAEDNAWAYHISDPERPEEVPVYLKNPKWISIINPVIKFIDIIPGYKEVDISIYFLVAFALFFAMLVGDAGYGALFLLIAIFLRKKLSPQVRVLIYVLSGATILWGVLSGTYFGSEQIAAVPFLNELIISEISSFGVDNISFMMYLSFCIGAIHLTIAHCIRVVQFINSIKLLSELGWIALVWGLFFVVNLLVLGKEMPSWGIWLFVVGVALVALFSMESKSFIKSILVSLANLPLSLINGFSDVVSYVRLFAVGMATATVAYSFNNMILPDDLSELGVIKLIFAVIALLLGHGLNIVLALMAVMVHGIRLNMLEFAGHLGIQFSGKAYDPFKFMSADNGNNKHS